MKSTSKLFIFIFTVLVVGASAYGQSPREQLQQMVEQLQKTPNDNVLREKIIKLSITIQPAPAIPEEAREPFVMGGTMLKKASNPAGASKAVDLFTQALNIAPWFADAYYNRAIARETAGQYESAIDDLKLYLEFKLTESERREAQDKIYSLKADIQLAAAKKAEAEKTAAAKIEADTPQAREAALLQKVEGARFVVHTDWRYFISDEIYEIKNQTLILTYRLLSWTGPVTMYGDYKRPGDYIIATMRYRNGAFTRTDSNFTYVFRIRPDGQALIAEGAFITNEPGSRGSDKVIPRQ